MTKFKVTPMGIVKLVPISDSKNPEAYSEELIIPRDIFIEAFSKFVNQFSNERMKQYQYQYGNMLMWHYEEDPELRCQCGCGSYRYEYDKYNDRLYVFCQDCDYVGEVMPGSLRDAILKEGCWRYEENEYYGS